MRRKTNAAPLLAAMSVMFAVVAVVFAVIAVMASTAQAREVEPDWTWEIAPSDNTNNAAMERLMVQDVEDTQAAIEDAHEQVKAAIEKKAEAEYQAWLASQAPAYGGGYGGSYTMPYSELYGTNGPTRTMPGWHDGSVETYYNGTAHFMADEWTLDSEGFYHDSEGRYVIGVDINSGYEYGDVVQTGKGEAIVFDYGAGVSNVHDFATNW